MPSPMTTTDDVRVGTSVGAHLRARERPWIP